MLVEEHRFAFKLALVLVAARAGHILVQPLQRELGALVVIEERGFPFRRVMAVHARRHAGLLKLLAMRVFVASFALERRRREVRLHQFRLHVWRLVAIDTGRCLVRPGQHKVRLAVVKALDILPVLGGVAGLATRWRSIRPRLLHALGELVVVRVLVTGLAIQIIPVIEHHRLGLGVRVLRLFMAVRAGDGNVAAREGEPRILVPLQCERRRLEAVHRVAVFALVLVGRGGELPVVRILVAVRAILELDLVLRVLAFVDVALGAIHCEVLPFQRIVARVMILGREGRRLESIDRMAGRALNPLRTLGELPVVRIRQMAIRTLGERNLFLEIAALVAGCTIHGGMLAQQRILRLRVIEVLIHSGQRNPLPSCRAVARLASLRETAVVEVGVAIGALAEWKSRVTRLAIRARRMALLALHLRVLPGEGVTRLAVIELPYRDRFPVRVVVALQAIGPKAPLVLVFVAGRARLRDPQERPRQILDLDHSARRRRNVLRRMALVAGHVLMFSFQNVARQLVVKRLRVPLDEREIFAVVLRVALGTGVVTAFGKVVGGVQPLAHAQPSGDFRMAGEALQRRRRTELVAVGAMQRAVQRFMGAGKRPRRDLRRRRRGKERYSQNAQSNPAEAIPHPRGRSAPEEHSRSLPKKEMVCHFEGLLALRNPFRRDSGLLSPSGFWARKSMLPRLESSIPPQPRESPKVHSPPRQNASPSAEKIKIVWQRSLLRWVVSRGFGFAGQHSALPLQNAQLQPLARIQKFNAGTVVDHPVRPSQMQFRFRNSRPKSDHPRTRRLSCPNPHRSVFQHDAIRRRESQIRRRFHKWFRIGLSAHHVIRSNQPLRNR